MIDILSKSFTSRIDNHQESQSIGHGHGNGRTSFRDFFRKRSADGVESSSGEPSSKSKRNTNNGNNINGRRRHSTSDLARSNSNKPPSTNTRRSSAVALPRPPSIPSSIHQLVSVSENAQGEGEGEGGYESDHSVVSEMTLMTYSDEKAGLIKEEFFRRMKEEGSEDLTMDEKEDVLREIQVEQEEQFKRKIELERLKCRKCVRTRVQDGDKANENEDNEGSSEKDEFFERLKELQQHLKKDGSVLLFSQQDGDKDPRQEEKKKDVDAHAHDAKAQLPERRGSNNNNKASTSITRRRSSLASSFCSVRTTQQGNLRRRSSKLSDTMSTNVEEEEEAMIDNDTSVIPKSDKKPIGGAKSKSLTSFYAPKSKKKSDGRNRDQDECKQVLRRSVSFNDTENKNENSSTHADISDIIELKLLVANQQATIDTLSSKLHNLELANHRRLKELEVEKSTLANQLLNNDCREKEIIICQNKELVRLRQVDRCFDALVRDHQQQQQKNELLEERNEDLMRENSLLQHQLNELKLSLGLGLVATGEGQRRCSNETPDTLASTEAVSVANTL